MQITNSHTNFVKNILLGTKYGFCQKTLSKYLKYCAAILFLVNARCKNKNLIDENERANMRFFPPSIWLRFKMLLKKIQVGQFDRKNVIRKYSFVKPIKGQEMLFE